MATKRIHFSKNSLKGLDPSSPRAGAVFALAASAYTERAVRTKAKAQETLIREGILTPTGRLKKVYAPAKG